MKDGRQTGALPEAEPSGITGICEVYPTWSYPGFDMALGEACPGDLHFDILAAQLGTFPPDLPSVAFLSTTNLCALICSLVHQCCIARIICEMPL